MDVAVENTIKIFKTLADETRLNIILTIIDDAKTVSAIVNATGASQSCVSHQLKLLKENKIVKSSRIGKCVYYSLDDSHIKEIVLQTILHASED